MLRKAALRADVCKYRPEACNKENIKTLKKIHKVALGELLIEIYFLLRSDNCFRRTEVSSFRSSRTWLSGSHTVHREKPVNKIKTILTRTTNN